jgi:AAA+ ATPase superfamily predicted ATPase
MDNYTLLNNRILLTGKTKSGKSRLLKYLVKSELKSFSKIIVVCPTEKINRFYADIVDEEFIFDEYNEEYFEELIKKIHETEIVS